jgi:hypothetical protein
MEFLVLIVYAWVLVKEPEPHQTQTHETQVKEQQHEI